MAQWLRVRSERNLTNNGTYIDIENGARLGVREYSWRGAKWEVWMKPTGTSPVEALADGYATQEEALAALDDLMAETDFRQLQPPQTEEEKADEESAEAQEEEVK